MNQNRRKGLQSVGSDGIHGIFKALELAKGLTAESNTLRVLQTANPEWLVSARTATVVEDKRGIDLI